MKTTIAWFFGLMLLVAMGSVLTVCSTLEEDRPVPVVALNDQVNNPEMLSYPPPVPAKCTYKGRVVDLPDRLPGCMLNIQLRDGRLLYPIHMEPVMKLREHDLVAVSFEPVFAPQPYECMGDPVIITCITLRNADQEDYAVERDKRMD